MHIVKEWVVPHMNICATNLSLDDVYSELAAIGHSCVYGLWLKCHIFELYAAMHAKCLEVPHLQINAV